MPMYAKPACRPHAPSRRCGRSVAPRGVHVEDAAHRVDELGTRRRRPRAARAGRRDTQRAYTSTLPVARAHTASRPPRCRRERLEPAHVPRAARIADEGLDEARARCNAYPRGPAAVEAHAHRVATLDGHLVAGLRSRSVCARDVPRAAPGRSSTAPRPAHPAAHVADDGRLVQSGACERVVDESGHLDAARQQSVRFTFATRNALPFARLPRERGRFTTAARPAQPPLGVSNKDGRRDQRPPPTSRASDWRELPVPETLDGARLDKAIVSPSPELSRRGPGGPSTSGRSGSTAVACPRGPRSPRATSCASTCRRWPTTLPSPTPSAPVRVLLETPLRSWCDKPAGQPTAPAPARRDRDPRQCARSAATPSSSPTEEAFIGHSPREPGRHPPARHRDERRRRRCPHRGGVRDAQGRAARRPIEKRYLLVCAGEGLPEEGTIEFPLANHPKDQRRVYACIHPA